MVRVAIYGAAGQMGQRLLAMVADDARWGLAAAVEQPGHDGIGSETILGVPLGDRFDGDADVAVDFSTAEATIALVHQCVAWGMPMVIGTTGLADEHERTIDQAATKIPIVQASNFSLVVAVLNRLAVQAAKLLGDEYDIEILEAHHRFKVDAPSGTAITLARTLCDALGRSFEEDVVYSRYGTEAQRRAKQITVQALRLGDHVGEHTAYFAALGERLELKHVSTSRDSYARGALHAASWLMGKTPGRYSMADVLGF